MTIGRFFEISDDYGVAGRNQKETVCTFALAAPAIAQLEQSTRMLAIMKESTENVVGIRADADDDRL